MAIISAEVRIDASNEKVWEALADFGGIEKFQPFISKSYSTSENVGGVGAARRCEFYDGGHVDEEVTAWREGEGMTIVVKGGTFPLKKLVGHLAVRSEGDGTIARLEMDFRLKYGPLGALMTLVVAKRQFEQRAKMALAGLKYHVESGNVVGDKVPELTEAM